MPDVATFENAAAIGEGKERPVAGELILLYWKEMEVSERNVVKIAEFQGVPIGLVRLDETVVAQDTLFQSLIPVKGYVVVSAETLARCSRACPGAAGWRRLLVSLAAEVLVYGFEPSPQHGQMLLDLTCGGLAGVEALQTGQAGFRVEDGTRQICRQWSGLNVGSADPKSDFTFIEGARQRDYSILIWIGSKPFFVSARAQGCRLLLVACRYVADLDERVPSTSSILAFFSRLVPLMMFFRWASGDRSWQNRTPQACFIVDDPLLSAHYGFLDYKKLLELMEREQFSTSVAFIPWNYRRSDLRVAQLLRSQPRRYSLCVHGCDHTAREFAGTDERLLQERAQRALDRMALHQQLTGLVYDDVMVFPQGIFSAAAMRALAARGYLAAVNSTPYATDDADDQLALRELLDVAVTRFSNFPLFVRRYPKNLSELAFDLFLGKPALLVEHHGYFRDGYGALAEVVQQLNALDERLQWARLGEVCSRACLTRAAENGDIHVRFQCDRFWLQNTTSRPQNYVLFRRRAPEEPMAGVSINGFPAVCTAEAHSLKVPLSVGSGQTVGVQILRGSPDPVAIPGRPRRIENARVFLRRHLCEFRDNHLHRSRLMRGIVSSARIRFPRKNVAMGS